MERIWLNRYKKKITRQSLVERAANGCRNPRATPNQRFIFALLTSRL